MSVELHFNQQCSHVSPGASLFDCAEALGIKGPTSCRKQGMGKECLAEVSESMECLGQIVLKPDMPRTKQGSLKVPNRRSGGRA